MNRREFARTLGATVLSFGLLDSLWASQALSPAAKPLLSQWVKNLNTYCQDLRIEAVTPAEWQVLVEALYAKLPLEDLVSLINFEHLQKGFSYPDLGVNTAPVTFPRLEGLPTQTAFVKKIFGMQRDRAIIPHGHTHMASAHLVLQGQMHLRHYDRVGQEGSQWQVKPTVDRTVQRGDYSTISDERDNVHWFVAESATAFTFDVIMLDLQGAQYTIHNLDMYQAESLGDGTLRVPELSVEEALAKYGKESHH